MKTIIAGTRDMIQPITNTYYAIQLAEKKYGFNITAVFSGKSGNVDNAGERWAKYSNRPVFDYHANWEEYGPGAGPIRNREMAKNADALIAVWDGLSSGTKNMIEEAVKNRLAVLVFIPPTHSLSDAIVAKLLSISPYWRIERDASWGSSLYWPDYSMTVKIDQV